MNVVAVRLGALGDVALTTGVLHWWQASLGLRATVITKAPLAPLFDHHPGVTAVLPVTAQDLTARGWLQLCQRLAHSFAGQPLIDLHGTPRTRILSLLWRGPVHRAPKMTLMRWLFLATHHPWLGKQLLRSTIPQRYALALQQPPPEATTITPRFFLSDKEHLAAAAVMARLGVDRPLALHPYATHPAKTPNRAWWLQLRASLHAAGIPTLIIGHHPAPLEPNDPHDRTGQDSLRQTLALLSQCQGLVTGDSGPLHLACGVDTPVFALFGPTTAHWGFAPQGSFHAVLQAPCPKAPCSLHGQARCPDGQRCLDELDIAQTVQSIMAWLAGRYSPPPP